ncbi:MAG: hypothetical protein R3217_09195 [Gammaproteobacteria bacterium]|nr:hypothetical protein [Gammaproteobacteria bacterium]
MSKKILPAFVTTILLFTLAGCATTETVDYEMDDPLNSMIFGYVDMEDAPTGLDWASLKQVQPASETPYWSFAVEDGAFFQPYLREGAYQLAAFGGSSFLGGNNQYNFPEYGSDGIVVTRPGLYFVGAYRYVEVDTGWLEQDKFDLEPIEGMSEIDVLRMLLEHDDIKDSPNWQRRIEARIRALSK